jgi:hypothetical protein
VAKGVESQKAGYGFIFSDIEGVPAVGFSVESRGCRGGRRDLLQQKWRYLDMFFLSSLPHFLPLFPISAHLLFFVSEWLSFGTVSRFFFTRSCDIGGGVLA